MTCKHYEIINSEGLGICQYCGQQRQYDSARWMEPPTLVKEGRKEGNSVIPCPHCSEEFKRPAGLAAHIRSQHPEHRTAAIKKGRKLVMTKELCEELLELGPAGFAKRHGYSHRAHGLFTQFYDRLQAGTMQATQEMSALPLLTKGPALRILIETNDRGKIGEIMNEIHLDNLLRLSDVRVEMSLTI